MVSHKLSLLLAALILCLGCCTASNDHCDILKTRTRAQEVFLHVNCLECEVAIEATRLFISDNQTEHIIEDVIDFFCNGLHIEDHTVCFDIVVEFQDFFFYILTQEALSPHVACGILGSCEKPVYPTWNVTFPTPQPPIKPYPSVGPSNPRVFFLSITDIHVDMQYTPGLTGNCGEPLCCRPPNAAVNGTDAAGKWGNYNCDIPQWVYENMLQYVAKNFPELHFAVFTGDMPPHDVWLETRDTTIQASTLELDLFKKLLPNVPLFSAMGNHESVPVNEFSTRDIHGQWDMDWLYTPMAKMWGQWIPPDAVKQAQFAGYYTALTPDGTRLVSMNTNLGCNNENWWLTLPSQESADPDQQLHWLVKTLQAAEDSGEMVYMLMHIGAGGNCEERWWKNFYLIIQRYQNIILGTFAGHTHSDLTHVTYENTTATGDFRPMQTTYFPGSVTTYQQINPGFRIYEMDAKTKALVDFKQYVYNITQANVDGYPTWYLEYSALADYQMKNLSPSAWHNLAMRMQKNHTMLAEYAGRRNHGYDTGPCDATCLFDAWCDMWVSPPGFNRICGE